MEIDLEAMTARMPPGFRFQPSDLELVEYYLGRTIRGQPLPFHIPVQDLYAQEPWKLFEGSSATELYFFTWIKKKFNGGKYFNRTVGTVGTWVQQYDHAVVSTKNDECRKVGSKRHLNFILGSGKAKKPGQESWIMHEYVLASNHFEESGDDQDILVLCKIHRGRENKDTKSSKHPPKRARTSSASASPITSATSDNTVQQEQGQYLLPGPTGLGMATFYRVSQYQPYYPCIDNVETAITDNNRQGYQD
ncbi:hypothetical protein IFM89_018289 [Coptis chinensis]|uniref:NAC domain-containing protein n=1 Tax=Coptis chinensis TaxID=261450 RepID=A0A835I8J3_9MAGN|nr:hypothetical protein IFM89_018289 [Coptis chinensis]